MRKALIYWFSFLFILLWMTSCGTRKSEKSKEQNQVHLEQSQNTTEHLVVKDTSNVKETTVSTKTEVSVTVKKTYSPVDPTKPASVTDSKGEMKNLNNASYTEETTTAKKDDKATKDIKSATGLIADHKLKKAGAIKLDAKNEKQNRVTDRESPDGWNLLWILIPIALFVIYLKLK